MANPPQDTPPKDTPSTNAQAADDRRQSLQRVGGGKGLSLSERLVASISDRLYASPLHALRLRGQAPLKLLGVAQDPVPGDTAVGERLVAGRLIHAGHTGFVRDLDFGAASHPPAWKIWANGWSWLRDLAAHPLDPKAAASLAEPLVARWLARFPAYEAMAWRPDVSGQRLLMVFSHAPLVLSSSDQLYRSSLLSAVATWARHLDRAAVRIPDSVGRVRALAGLWAAGLLLPGGEPRAGAAAAAMMTTLERLVLPDGGTASRAPGDAREIAELLLHVRAALRTAERPEPSFLKDTLDRLLNGLRTLALGGGMVGAWGGSAPLASAVMARLGDQAGLAPHKPPRNEMKISSIAGYQRLSAGTTMLLVDAGPPPLARLAPDGHASTLSFEMSDGPSRLIVNCGGARGLPAPLPSALAAGLRTSAAHSNLIVADTNSTRIREDGALGLGVENVDLETRASTEGLWLEASHDGYARRFGLMVRRRLWLAPDGLDLRGEEALEPLPASGLRRRGPRSFDIRFHLGADVEATPTADSAGALLKLPGGKLWQMKARGGTLAIEPSLWVDPDGQLHKTSQLVISGQTEKGARVIGWSLKRAGR